MKRIYISDAVHEHLKMEAKRDGRTLQWVVEHKLMGNTSPETPPSPENTEAKTSQVGNLTTVGGKNYVEGQAPRVDDLFNMPDPDDIRQSNAELDCCKHPTRPCKHWVWDNDSGEGYKNILSGRIREAD